MTERQRIYRAADGVRRRLIWDDEDPDEFRVLTEQDVEPVLDGVARDREIMSHNGVNKLLARVPIEVYERSVHERWDEGDWKRYLNPAHRRPRRSGIWRERSVTQLTAAFRACQSSPTARRLRGTASTMRRGKAVRNTGTCNAPQRRWRRCAHSSAISRS